LRKLTFSMVCVVGAFVLTFGSSASAVAAKMTLTVGAEPVESITTQLGASASEVGQNTEFWLKVKPSGGEACAANPNADHGTSVISDYYSFENAPAYSDSVNHTFEAAGSYLVCGWLIESGDPEVVLANPSITVSVRQPHLQLSISTPPHVLTGQTFQISTTAQAETARSVTEYMIPNVGDRCPANAAAAAQAAGVLPIRALYDPWSVTGGPFTETVNETVTNAGAYLICAYFEYPSTESPPELTASATTDVTPPPPPCVVPFFTQKMHLTTVERRISAGHCTVGKIEYVLSKLVRRGAVIRLGSRPGTKLSTKAAVAIVVSKGSPKRHRGRR
jgi:hypothetical protein